MKIKKNFYIVITFVLTVSITVIAYYVGRNSVTTKLNDNMESWNECRCFYATVTGIDEGTLSVEGENYNDINYRGKYVLELTGDEVVEWRSEKIQISDLELGARIAIYFTGYKLETSPARIAEVIRIEILDN